MRLSLHERTQCMSNHHSSRDRQWNSYCNPEPSSKYPRAHSTCPLQLRGSKNDNTSNHHHKQQLNVSNIDNGRPRHVVYSSTASKSRSSMVVPGRTPSGPRGAPRRLRYVGFISVGLQPANSQCDFLHYGNLLR